MSGPGVVGRVLNIEIENFRGFGTGPEGRSYTIPTDADIVLLAGPNGYGKTSLIEALSLLLNQHHRYSGREETLFHFESRDFSMKATVEMASDDGMAGCERREKKTITIAGRQDPKPEIRIDWIVAHPIHKDSERSSSSPQAEEEEKKKVPSETLDKWRELESRMTTFYQDDVDRLFDEKTQGRTLREVFEPLPPEILGIAKVLEDRIQDFTNDAENLRKPLDEKERSSIRSRLQRALETLRDSYKVLADGPEWPKLPGNADNDTLSWFFSALGQLLGLQYDEATLPNLARSILNDAWKREEAKARTAGALPEKAAKRLAELEAKRQDLSRERRAIAERFPLLAREVERFNSPDSRLPGLLEIFESLEGNAVRWAADWPESDGAGQPFPGALTNVLEELRRVRPVDAGKCRVELGTWLEPRAAAAKRDGECRREIERIEEKISALRRSARWMKLRRIEGYLRNAAEELQRAWKNERDWAERERVWDLNQQRADRLEEIKGEVERLQQVLDTERARLPSYIHDALEKNVNAIARRLTLDFDIRLESLVSKDPQTDEERSYFAFQATNERPKAKEDVEAKAAGVPVVPKKPPLKRSLDALSTGQKSQAAVALLVAQNRLATHLLSHRVLLLDDISSSYDLANLTREAILWRQLAYCETGVGHRQIFIASHHEDMTNRLLDLLSPIAGGKMLVIRFENWKPLVGPTLQFWVVEPDSALDGEGAQATVGEGKEGEGGSKGDRKSLAVWMKEHLCTNFA
jgi:energy-coupling factor transporter ATP-binding protein EcfA2